jgi:hypothetical protein
MENLNTIAKKRIKPVNAPVVREYDIGGNFYIVKSIFVGDKDVKTVLLKLAEKKAVREMGLEDTTP